MIKKEKGIFSVQERGGHESGRIFSGTACIACKARGWGNEVFRRNPGVEVFCGEAAKKVVPQNTVEYPQRS